MHGEFDEAEILAIERPDPRLWVYYVITCLLVFPLAPILLPIHWFRYHSMRYRFTDEGVSMSWGVLFRRQVLLNYSRIQDIHLQSNVLERWLGLARVQLQTASGSSSAEMTLEGLPQFEAIRDFLYARMRGVREAAPRSSSSGAPQASEGAGHSAELAKVLREIAADLRAIREALSVNGRKPDDSTHV